jgi:hypothetical protein
MPRSEASLARRAKKRGRTIDEQRKIDRERDRGYKGKQWDASLIRNKRRFSRNEVSIRRNPGENNESDNKKRKTNPDTVAPPENFKTEKYQKNRKEEERETWTCLKCKHNENWTTRYKCRECAAPRYNKKERKERDKKWVNPAVANNWKNPASEETIKQNAALRAAFEACPEAMDETDRNRARILIERSERKKKKKMMRRKAHESRTNFLKTHPK